MSKSETIDLRNLFGYMPTGCESMKAILHRDPCAYCGQRPSGTVDHIAPCLRGSKHSGGRAKAGTWQALTGACRRCNSRKGSTSLLHFLLETA